MAKKDNAQNGTISIGEIGTIRNILMGEQINQYEKKFQELEATVAQLKTDFAQQLKEQKANSEGGVSSLKTEIIKQIETIGSSSTKEVASIKKDMETKFSVLNSSIKEKNELLEKQIKDSELSQRQYLGRLLVEIGENLLDT